jgi:hypothetical protein
MQRWRLAVKTALVLLVIEGALRKWVLPGAQDLTYFAKDLILVGAYIGFLRDEARSRLAGPSLPIVSGMLLLGGLFGLVEVFNPELPSLMVGILGWKSYFLYVPLLWVIPALFRTDAELWTFLRRYVLLALPIGLLGTLQFRAPVDSALNTYARGGPEADVATFGSQGHARVTGTFSYISGYSMYLQATAILILALLASRNWRIREDRWLFVTLAVTILGMFSTGSRGPVLMLVLLLPVYLAMSVLRERGGSSTFLRLAGATAVLAILLGLVGDEAFTAFRERATGSSDAASRLLAPFVSPFNAARDVGVFGFGIGATHQAAKSLVGNEMLLLEMRMPAYEAESGRVMVELGPVGFLLTYLPRIFLILYAATRMRAMRSTFHRALAVSCLLFLLTQITGAIVFEVTTGLFYWFFAGLLMLTVRLDAALPVAATTTKPGAGLARQRAFA